ncbi:hypothetical protein [uncultured Shewanella sp.]|uniref:hypothetical protein n=1 Tax=uncultured Shewanella sp. TaxID=173975 RepID=UPI00262ABBA8|nr:hypothetical protein [uncultured Shewanella sp.]
MDIGMKIISCGLFLLVVTSCLLQGSLYAKDVDINNKGKLSVKGLPDNTSQDNGLDVSNKGLASMALHSHLNRNVPKNAVTPKLDLQLFVDSKSGYNLHILYEDFELESPEFLDLPKRKVEGHAHLFINGKKVQRVYGAYLHLEPNLFEPGVNSISVTLNSHDHDTWSIDDKPIVATYFINNQVSPLIQHYFSAFPVLRSAY